MFLLFRKADILLSNDLDTLLPNFLITRLKKQKLVYDSHEYFTGVPELAGRPVVRSIWKTIERIIFPRLKYVYTVNQSIASLYKTEYKVNVKVIRNLPEPVMPVRETDGLKEKLGLPRDKFIIILQGNGINMHRGAEEAVQAMQYLNDGVLLIAGNGDVIEILKKMTQDLNLCQKVIFKARMPMDRLIFYTQCAQLGLTLDKDTNINYRYSLPNKLFDYIQCRVPVLGSNLPEVAKIIEQYKIGDIIYTHEPKAIAEKFHSIINNPSQQAEWKKNLEKAAAMLSWNVEKPMLLQIFKEAEEN